MRALKHQLEYPEAASNLFRSQFVIVATHFLWLSASEEVNRVFRPLRACRQLRRMFLLF
ncbi:hypothetical protein BDK61_3673 [Haloarcula quadrata]|uniref:Uncharacterized protein n=1 Tax=Haloarcula quadrata TaxID=182779 RepID=A0A495QV53_9EURY|nr:hypothetical protein BDK61_3673 [Haloarcula quadrata]